MKEVVERFWIDHSAESIQQSQCRSQFIQCYTCRREKVQGASEFTPFKELSGVGDQAFTTGPELVMLKGNYVLRVHIQGPAQDVKTAL
jgi:hypothetical protein